MRIVQLASLLVYAIGAMWYVRSLLNRLGRADALIALLWVHVFRYVALFTISEQHAGFPISDAAVFEVVAGDTIGAAMALLAISLLRLRWNLGVVVSWLLVFETIVDFAVGVRRKIMEPLTIEPGGVLYLILGFFVPLVVVSIPFLVWQLTARRREPLALKN